MNKVLLTREEHDRSVAASIWAGQRVAAHVVTEFTNDTDRILETVADHDKLVYAVGWPDDHGSIKLHALSSRVDAREHYDSVRRLADIVSWRPFTEIRRDWYVFYDGVVTLRYRTDGVEDRKESIVLFPTGDQQGILGELGWFIHPDAKHADQTSIEAPNPVPLSKLENLVVLEKLMAASVVADIPGISELLSDDIGTSLRDYVDDRPYRDLQGKHAALAYYESFFEKFSVTDLHLVNRVIGEWFIFAELQWSARCLSGEMVGRMVNFCTATMYTLQRDGRIGAQMGWGTDPLHFVGD